MSSDIERSRDAVLIVQLEGLADRSVPLTRMLSIGRTPDNDLVLEDRIVSRRHAELRISPEGEVLLSDLGSANGTFVAGTRLPPQQPQRLADGDTFQIGPFRLVYRAAASAGTVSPRRLPSLAQRLRQPDPRTQLGTLTPPAFGAPSRYLQDLPIPFHDNEFLGRFLKIFEAIWEPLEQRQNHIAMYFDPRTCPSSFLPWLAGWLDFPLDARWPEERLRILLAEAYQLLRWRGTRQALVRVIEICTGLTPEITEYPTQPFVITIRLTTTAMYQWNRDLVEDLVRTFKPAHIGYVLEIAHSE